METLGKTYGDKSTAIPNLSELDQRLRPTHHRTPRVNLVVFLLRETVQGNLLASPERGLIDSVEIPD